MACADNGAVECEYALAEEEVVEGEGGFGILGEAGGSICWRRSCSVGTKRCSSAGEWMGAKHTEYWVYRRDGAERRRAPMVPVLYIIPRGDVGRKRFRINVSPRQYYYNSVADHARSNLDPHLKLSSSLLTMCLPWHQSVPSSKSTPSP